MVERLDFDAEAPARIAALRVATALKLPDCCVLDAAERTGALATFDERLARASAERGVLVHSGAGSSSA